MQISKVQNTQQFTPNFNGKMIVYNELSSVAANSVSRAAGEIKELVKDKPYDMFLGENPHRRMIEIIAQKLSDFGVNNTRRIEYDVPIDYNCGYDFSKNKKLLVTASKEAGKDYENLPASFIYKTEEEPKKVSKWNKFLEKALSFFQDKDEV